MTTRAVVLRNILHYGILLLVLFILQSMIFPHLRLMGVTPLLIPLAVVGAGLFSGTTIGGVFGICAGIVCDMTMVETSVLFTLLMAACGIITGLLGENALARGFPSFLLCSVTALLIIAAAQLFGLVAYRGVAFSAVLGVAWRQSVYSLIFVIPVYWAVRGTSRRAAKEY